MKVTIEELAKQANVSISTVSNVLNNKGNVSDAKREEVLQLAQQLGYDLMKRRKVKKTQDSDKVLIVFPSHSSQKNMNYYISEVLLGVEEAFSDTGCTLIVKSFNDSYDFLPGLLEQGFDGLLLIGGLFPDHFLLQAAELDCPVLTIATYTLKRAMQAVVADNQMGVYQAASHLISMGHANIGFINGPSTTNTSRSKLQGFKEALLSAGIDPGEAWVTNSEFTLEDSYAAAKRFLALRNRPTALLTGDDRIAMGAIKLFQEEGISIPGDVAVIGYGNSSSGQYITPALTTVNVFQKKLGRMGAQRLMDIIEKRKEGIQSDIYRLVQPTELIVRQSCGVAHAK